tara:strand:- start:146 stop:358 length:213 start_codon:yes stop_codon:yes gene_type:complete
MSYNSDIDKLNRTTETLSSVIRNLKTYQQPSINVSSEISRCRNELDSANSALHDLEFAIDQLEKKLKGDE